MDTKIKQHLIGMKLKNFRKLSGYTQERLCEAINIDISALSKIENGKCYPSLDTLCLIMEELKINPSELFDFISFGGSGCDSIILEKIKSLSDKDKKKVTIFIDLLKD